MWYQREISLRPAGRDDTDVAIDVDIVVIRDATVECCAPKAIASSVWWSCCARKSGSCSASIANV